MNDLHDLLERAADEGPLADAHNMYDGAQARARTIRTRRRITTALFTACVIALVVVGMAAIANNGARKRHVDVAHPTPTPLQHYQVDVTVLQDASHGPQLCLGGVATSLPPQCGGVPVTNWDWTKVTGYDDRNGTKWGYFHLVGTYDGTSFTVTDQPERGRVGHVAGPMPVHLSTPCPTPPGGWKIVDPSKIGLNDYTALTPAAESQPDYGGSWMDASFAAPGSVNDLTHSVMNFTFTGDLERHRAELARIWGGPICVSPTKISQAERQRIQKALIDDPTLHTTQAFTDERTGVVTANVVVATPELQHKVDAEYGAGRVKLVGDLTPVG